MDLSAFDHLDGHAVAVFHYHLDDHLDDHAVVVFHYHLDDHLDDAVVVFHYHLDDHLDDAVAVFHYHVSANQYCYNCRTFSGSNRGRQNMEIIMCFCQ